MLLTACSPKVITKSVPVAPPSQYYDGDCSITPYVITDNASMANAVRSLINDIRVCSADRKAIRAWKEKL